MTEQLQKKVERALKLLKSASKNDVVEISYSGGKDSDVFVSVKKLTSVISGDGAENFQVKGDD